MPSNERNPIPELQPPASAVATLAFARALDRRASAFRPQNILGAGSIGARGRAAVSLSQSLMGRTRFSLTHGRADWLAGFLSRYRFGAWSHETPTLAYLRRLRGRPGGATETEFGVSEAAFPLRRQSQAVGVDSPPRTADSPARLFSPSFPSPHGAVQARVRRDSGEDADFVSAPARQAVRRLIPLLPDTLNATRPVPTVLQRLHAKAVPFSPGLTDQTPLRSAFPEQMAETVARRAASPSRRTAEPLSEQERLELPMALSYPPVPLVSWLGQATPAPEGSAWESAPGFARPLFNPAGSHTLVLPKLSAEPVSRPVFEHPSQAAFAALPRMAAPPAARHAADAASEAVWLARATATQPLRPSLEKRIPTSPIGMRSIPAFSPEPSAGEPSSDGGDAPPASHRSPLRAAQAALKFVQRRVAPDVQATFANRASVQGQDGLTVNETPVLERDWLLSRLALPRLRRQAPTNLTISEVWPAAPIRHQEEQFVARPLQPFSAASVTPERPTADHGTEAIRVRAASLTPLRPPARTAILPTPQTTGLSHSIPARTRSFFGLGAAETTAGASPVSATTSVPRRRATFSETLAFVRDLALPRAPRVEQSQAIPNAQAAFSQPPLPSRSAVSAPALWSGGNVTSLLAKLVRRRPQANQEAPGTVPSYPAPATATAESTAARRLLGMTEPTTRPVTRPADEPAFHSTPLTPQMRISRPELRGPGVAPASRLPDAYGLPLRPLSHTQSASGNVLTAIQMALAPIRRILASRASQYNAAEGQALPGQVPAVGLGLPPRLSQFVETPAAGRAVSTQAFVPTTAHILQSTVEAAPFSGHTSSVRLALARPRPSISDSGTDRSGQARQTASISPSEARPPAVVTPGQTLISRLASGLLSRYAEMSSAATTQRTGEGSPGATPFDDANRQTQNRIATLLSPPLLRFLTVGPRQQTKAGQADWGTATSTRTNTLSRFIGNRPGRSDRGTATSALNVGNIAAQLVLSSSVVSAWPPRSRLSVPATDLLPRRSGETPRRQETGSGSVAAWPLRPSLSSSLSRPSTSLTLPLRAPLRRATVAESAQAERSGSLPGVSDLWPTPNARSQDIEQRIAPLSAGSPAVRRFLDRWLPTLSGSLALPALMTRRMRQGEGTRQGEGISPLRIISPTGEGSGFPRPARFLRSAFPRPRPAAYARGLMESFGAVASLGARGVAARPDRLDRDGGIDDASFSEAVGEVASRTLQSQLLLPIREFLIATLSRVFAPYMTLEAPSFAENGASQESLPASPPRTAADLSWLPSSPGRDRRDVSGEGQAWGVPTPPPLGLPSFGMRAALGTADAVTQGRERRALTVQDLSVLSQRIGAAQARTPRPRLPAHGPFHADPAVAPTSRRSLSRRTDSTFPSEHAALPRGRADAFRDAKPRREHDQRPLSLISPIDSLIARSSLLTTQDLRLPQRFTQTGPDLEGHGPAADVSNLVPTLTSLPRRPALMPTPDSGTRPPHPAGRSLSSLSAQVPAMPLPGRHASLDAQGVGMMPDPLLIQRAIPGGATAQSQSGPGTFAQEGEESDSGGGGQDVDKLAKEVWSHLRRRLANEAARAGRR